MSRDEKVSDAHFRLAFRIAQCRSEDTGWAEASHAFLIDEVPRTQKSKLRGFRDVMRDKLGWVRMLPGERGRGTMYQFRDERCAALEAESERKKEARHAAAALEKIDHDTALKVAGLGVNPDPSSASGTVELRGEILPPNGASTGVNPLTIEGQISTPLLPHSSTSPRGCRPQDVTQDARTHPHAGAPALTHTVPPQCSTCKNPATVELQLFSHETFSPHCGECREDLIWDAERPIGSSDERQVPVMSYWEASRGL
jgi:hypothetical protein